MYEIFGIFHIAPVTRFRFAFHTEWEYSDGFGCFGNLTVRRSRKSKNVPAEHRGTRRNITEQNGTKSWKIRVFLWKIVFFRFGTRLLGVLECPDRFLNLRAFATQLLSRAFSKKVFQKKVISKKLKILIFWDFFSDFSFFWKIFRRTK